MNKLQKTLLNTKKKIHYASPLLTKLLVITLIIAISMIELPLHRAYAAEDDMPGYSNPHDIIIATPANKYTTKVSSISILGSCDYEYPLYLNGELVETTEYGFFTVYVDLAVGENKFLFENNDKVKELTIIRKKSSTSSSGNSSGGSTSSASKITYQEYTKDTYGKVIVKYAMPRTKTSDVDLACMPLTRGTTFKILGEDKGYYKIADGTYVAKSSIKKYTKSLPNNKVKKAKIVNRIDRNQVVTELTMNVNALYNVSFEDNKAYLTLYQTVSAKIPSVPENNIIQSVGLSIDKENKQITYCFDLDETVTITGYDIFFNNGVMKFELKQATELGEDSPLIGTTVLLDAGHGNYDSGTVGPMGKYGPVEKDTNLSITLYAKEYLEQLGATVVLTRSNDTFYTLSDRVSKIRLLRPDISVSIHGNSLDYATDYSKVSGFLTYYSYSLGNNVADKINESIANELNLTVKPTRARSLSLTRLTTCPALLLETSFFSNPYDYEYLIKSENQKAFGYAIGKAVAEYLQGDFTR